MKKRFLLIVLIIITIFTASGCNKRNNSSRENKTIINIASLKGPTSIGLVKLYSESDAGSSYNSYNYNIYGTADEISTKLIKGELDAAAVPANLAAILYKKSEGEISIAGINTLGVLYILAKGCEINSVDELRGTTIYTTGRGTTPEYTLRHILSQNGINPDKDVNIEFFSEASEVVAKCSEMDSAIMMLPEPYVEVALSKDENLSVAIDTSAEWEDVVTGVIVVRKSFIDDKKDAFDQFMNEYKTSVTFANRSIDECADLLEKYDIFKANVAKKAIPKCNVTLITGQEMVTKLNNYFSVLYKENPLSLGGTIPDDNVYYIAE